MASIFSCAMKPCDKSTSLACTRGRRGLSGSRWADHHFFYLDQLHILLTSNYYVSFFLLQTINIWCIHIVCLYLTNVRREWSRVSLYPQAQLHVWQFHKVILNLWRLCLSAPIQNGIMTGVYPGSPSGLAMVLVGYMSSTKYAKMDPTLGLFTKLGERLPVR